MEVGESENYGHKIVHVLLRDNIMDLLTKKTYFTGNLLALAKFVKRGYKLDLNEDNQGDATRLHIFDKRIGPILLRTQEENVIYTVLKPKGKPPTSRLAMTTNIGHICHECLGHVGREIFLSASVDNFWLPSLHKDDLAYH